MFLMSACKVNLHLYSPLTDPGFYNFRPIRLRSHRTILFGIRYTLYVHSESYRVARAPYSVFYADPMDTSNEEDLALLLLVDMVLVFVVIILWIPWGASVQSFL